MGGDGPAGLQVGAVVVHLQRAGILQVLDRDLVDLQVHRRGGTLLGREGDECLGVLESQGDIAVGAGHAAVGHGIQHVILVGESVPVGDREFARVGLGMESRGERGLGVRRQRISQEIHLHAAERPVNRLLGVGTVGRRKPLANGRSVCRIISKEGEQLAAVRRCRRIKILGRAVSRSSCIDNIGVVRTEGGSAQLRIRLGCLVRHGLEANLDGSLVRGDNLRLGAGGGQAKQRSCEDEIQDSFHRVPLFVCY